MPSEHAVRDPEVEAFLEQATDWRDVIEALRSVALEAGLGEALKWGTPCYTAEGGNVAIVQPFKEACGFMFFKGALLEDPEGLLEPPGPNSQVGRRLMFTSAAQVEAMEADLRAFIDQAVEAERAGLEVPTEPEPIPDELTQAFEEVEGLQKAFEELTPGRQRGYILHISGAKQAKTRVARVERCVPRILEGKGLND